MSPEAPAPAPSPPPPVPDRARAWLLVTVGAAVLAGLVAFAPARSAGLVSDDIAMVREYPAIRDLAAIPSLFRRSVWPGLPSYRPLYLTALALEWRASGPDPRGYHATSLALYAAVCAAFVALARSLRLSRAGALAGALLFALAPPHAEAVALVYAQAELLAGGLALASLALHLSRAPGAPRDGRRALGAALALFAALFAKETAYATPLVALAVDLALGRLRPPAGTSLARHLARLYAPYAAALAAFLAVKGLLLGEVAPGGAAALVGDSTRPLAGLGALERARVDLHGVAHAVRRLVWPVDLAPSYDSDAWTLGASADAPRLALAAAPLAIALAALAVARERRPLAAALFLYTALLPTVNPLFVALTDRGLLLASAGLALGFGLAVEAAVARRGLALAAAPALALLATFAVEARVAVAAYHDPVAHWARAAKVDPRSLRARRELAVALHEARRDDEADAVAAEALAGRPDDAPLLHLRGVLALERRDLEAAVPLLEAAVARGDGPMARYHLGLALLGLGRRDRAEAELRAAAAALPEHAPSRYYLGVVLREEGRPAEAALEIEAARRLDPALVARLEGR